MFIKNHPNSPYFDDSHLDITVFRIDMYTIDGDLLDFHWCATEDEIEDEIRIMKKYYPDCAYNKVFSCDLGDCPYDVQSDILKRFEEDRAQWKHESKMEEL